VVGPHPALAPEAEAAHVTTVYPFPAPPLVTWGIAVIALALAVLFVQGHRTAALNARLPLEEVREMTAISAVVIVVWLGLFAGLALSGLLARFDLRPPPLLLGMSMAVVGALGFSLSADGKRLAQGLPLAALVGFQAFRLPLELVMHEAARAGVMPPQMTYTGWNFDIVTGVTAVLLAPAVARGGAPRWLVVAWNVVGLVLVTVVMGIGFVSTPVLHAFGEGRAVNEWIAWWPFVWLPAVMVAAAVAGHVLVFRRLRQG
jgi:hypothetical protein